MTCRNCSLPHCVVTETGQEAPSSQQPSQRQVRALTHSRRQLIADIDRSSFSCGTSLGRDGIRVPPTRRRTEERLRLRKKTNGVGGKIKSGPLVWRLTHWRTHAGELRNQDAKQRGLLNVVQSVHVHTVGFYHCFIQAALRASKPRQRAAHTHTHTMFHWAKLTESTLPNKKTLAVLRTVAHKVEAFNAQSGTEGMVWSLT